MPPGTVISEDGDEKSYKSLLKQVGFFSHTWNLHKALIIQKFTGRIFDSLSPSSPPTSFLPYICSGVKIKKSQALCSLQRMGFPAGHLLLRSVAAEQTVFHCSCNSMQEWLGDDLGPKVCSCSSPWWFSCLWMPQPDKSFDFAANFLPLGTQHLCCS